MSHTTLCVGLGNASPERSPAGWQTASQTRRGEVSATIKAVEGQIAGLECAYDWTDSRVPAGELDPARLLETLPVPRRSFWDGLCMIAYRTETQVATTVARSLGQPATVCSFFKALFRTDANLILDAAVGILRVPLLPLATTA